MRKAPSLVPFDSKKPMIVQADASQSGLGAVLLQGGKLVSSASRKLTEHEQNYAQIEKEMLALDFGATKFEPLIYAMPDVKFQTDHLPLVSIFQKPIVKITNNRFKKLRLKMLKFQPNVEYLPGKYMYLADLLSRDYLDDPVEDDPEMVEVVHEVVKNLPFPDEMLADLKQETGKDKGLIAVTTYSKKGWPNSKKAAEPESLEYWKHKLDLFVEDDLVILDKTVVIPPTLRKKVLNSLHTAHLGEGKTKARARQAVFWPGITNDIETMVEWCRVCERHRPANKKQPLIPHEIP